MVHCQMGYEIPVMPPDVIDSPMVCFRSVYVTALSFRLAEKDPSHPDGSFRFSMELDTNYKTRLHINNFSFIPNQAVLSNRVRMSMFRYPPMDSQIVIRKEEFGLSSKFGFDYTMQNYVNKPRRTNIRLEDNSICSNFYFYPADFSVPINDFESLVVLYHKTMRCFARVSKQDYQFEANAQFRMVTNLEVERKWNNINAAAFNSGFLFEITADNLIIITWFQANHQPSLAEPMGLSAGRNMFIFAHLPVLFPQATPLTYFMVDQKNCFDKVIPDWESLPTINWELLRPKPPQTVCKINDLWFGVLPTNDMTRYWQLDNKFAPMDVAGNEKAVSPSIFRTAKMLNDFDGAGFADYEKTLTEGISECFPTGVVPTRTVHMFTRELNTDKVYYARITPDHWLPKENKQNTSAPVPIWYVGPPNTPIPDDITYRHGTGQIVTLYGLYYSLHHINADLLADFTTAQVRPLTVGFLSPVYAMHADATNKFWFFTRARSVYECIDARPNDESQLQLQSVQKMDRLMMTNHYRSNKPVFEEGTLAWRGNIEEPDEDKWIPYRDMYMAGAQPPVTPKPNDNAADAINAEEGMSQLWRYVLYGLAGILAFISFIMGIICYTKSMKTQQALVVYSTSSKHSSAGSNNQASSHHETGHPITNATVEQMVTRPTSPLMKKKSLNSQTHFHQHQQQQHHQQHSPTNHHEHLLNAYQNVAPTQSPPPTRFVLPKPQSPINNNQTMSHAPLMSDFSLYPATMVTTVTVKHPKPIPKSPRSPLNLPKKRQSPIATKSARKVSPRKKSDSDEPKSPVNLQNKKSIKSPGPR